MTRTVIAAAAAALLSLSVGLAWAGEPGAGTAAPAAPSQPEAKAPAKAEAGMEKMTALQLVLLRRGPNWTPQVTPEVEELQKKHLGHLKAMFEAGKMVVAGPFDEQPDPGLRGLCLYRVGSVAEAKALAEQDPMVKAGRLKVEAMAWWYERAALAFPMADEQQRKIAK